VTTVSVPEAVSPPRERVQRHRAKYLPLFPRGSRVLDIGCADGVFLDLLAAHAIQGVGVEMDPDAALVARQRGHDVHCTDALSFLASRPGPFGGIFVGHVIEHMVPADARELVWLCARELALLGTLVILTPNYRDFSVRRQFWDDPTHVRPYPRRLLCGLVAEVGLEVLVCTEDADNTLRDPDTAIWKRVLKRLYNVPRRAVLGNYWHLGDIFLVARKARGHGV
jgi:2-polyprenyl-3-methyl-5-hydroxy-6-metoxy-1,4-benzoquinol methylase